MAKAKFKKSDEEAEDRLSALHDSLLHQILSLLDTKEVMRTCVLSKRWQFLWTDSSSLVLQDTSEDAASFRFSVRRILVLCAGIHLNKLCIEFMYNPRSAESVTLWIEFAIKSRIKDFTLLLRSIEHYYELPQIFYSNSSLTALTIGSCRIAPRGSIEWRFLKHLNIVNAEVLLEDLVQNILLGCPVLEILQLTKCRGYGFLKVCSPNLTTLVIDGWRNRTNNDRSLMISAPNLHVLSVSDERPTWCFVAGDFSSLVKAKVDYNLARSDVVLKQVASMQYPNVKQSLESFSSVKELELGPWCIEVLSRLEEKGLRLSSSTRLRLTLTVWRHRTSIGGILNILKSSPNLEMLVIKGIDFKHILIWDNQLQDDSWYLVLRALKTVNISGLFGEPMLTLVQLLLKSATNLEKMVIDATTSTSYSSATPCSLEFSKFKRKLFSFPRSSPKAIVVVR